MIIKMQKDKSLFLSGSAIFIVSIKKGVNRFIVKFLDTRIYEHKENQQ